MSSNLITGSFKLTKRKYTKENLEPFVRDSFSVAEVMRKLGLKDNGGTHSFISKRIKEFEIDRSHFRDTGRTIDGKIKKKTWQETLIINPNQRREIAYRLRRALIEFGREYVCELCSNGNNWNGQELRLEVDHKNNDCLDNRPENLRFLCPNCHSQQLHKMNQGKSRLMSGTIGTKKKCKTCDNLISKVSTYCRKCAIKPNKIKWPEIDILLKMIEDTKNYCEVARQLCVTDNAVRRRIKKFSKM